MHGRAGKLHETVVGERIPAIAGLRAIAVLMVTVNHYNTIAFTGWAIGNIGVAVFFSISGFLAYYVLRRDESRFGRISYSYFMTRRALRIWPLYFTCIALIFLLENLFGNMPSEKPLQYPPWSLFTFTFNFDLAQGRHAELPGLSVLWSIAVEEQFYLLAPLMYLAIRSRHSLVFCGMVFVLANLARWLHIAYAEPKSGGGIYYMTYAYADTFLAGAVLAHLYIKRTATLLPIASDRQHWGMAAAATVLFAVIAWTWGTSIFPPYPAWAWFPYFLVPAASVLALAAVIWSREFGLSKLLASKPFLAIGELSFGIYMVHVFVQHFLAHYTGREPLFASHGWLIYNLGTISVTVFAASVLYFVVERPALNLKDSAGMRIANPLAAILPAVAIAIGLAMVLT
jgi:peptidoglycan/LPS O-acetylase OafA/YrhL